MSENQTVLRAARPKLIICQSAYPYVCHVRENPSNKPLPPPDPWAMMKISKYQLQVRGFKPWLSPMECDQTDLLCLSGPSHLPCQGKKENLLLAYNNATAWTNQTYCNIIILTHHWEPCQANHRGRSDYDRQHNVPALQVIEPFLISPRFQCVCLRENHFPPISLYLTSRK